MDTAERIAQLEAENAELRREVERLERELEAKDEEWEEYTDDAALQAAEFAEAAVLADQM